MLENTGQIYVRGIFVEHSHDIFPEYLENVPYEFWAILPEECSGNIEYTNIPWGMLRVH